MPPLNPIILVVVLVTVTATGFVFGSIGAGLCKLFGQTRSAPA